MTNQEILEKYSDQIGDEEILTADGFEDAVVGIDMKSLRVIYDSYKMIDILKDKDEMTTEEAIEFLEFNVFGAWVGEKSPIFMI